MEKFWTKNRPFILRGLRDEQLFVVGRAGKKEPIAKKSKGLVGEEKSKVKFSA